jgi:hypothetical protein
LSNFFGISSVSSNPNALDRPMIFPPTRMTTPACFHVLLPIDDLELEFHGADAIDDLLPGHAMTGDVIDHERRTADVDREVLLTSILEDQKLLEFVRIRELAILIEIRQRDHCRGDRRRTSPHPPGCRTSPGRVSRRSDPSSRSPGLSRSASARSYSHHVGGHQARELTDALPSFDLSLLIGGDVAFARPAISRDDQILIRNLPRCHTGA